MNSSVPAQPPRRDAWWIEKCRRNRNSRPSGMRTARNCPGRAFSAISGATSVSEWYAPSFRVDRISARTCFTPNPRPRQRPGRTSAVLAWAPAWPRHGTPGSTEARLGIPRWASMPRTAANTPGSVVMHGTPGRRRGRADEVAVCAGTTTERGVHHQVDLTSTDRLGHVLRALAHLRDTFDGDAGALEHPGGSTRREQAETQGRRASWRGTRSIACRGSRR